MSTASESSPATVKPSYEDWKQSVMDADAEGVELWTEELSQASDGPLYRRQGALEGNGLAPVLVSVALLLACAIILIPKFKHLTQGERTVGMVVGHRTYGYGSSGGLRAPIIRYSAPGGVYETEADIPAAKAIYPEGKEVWVLFLRDEPGNAVVADFVQLFMIPTVVGGLGLICLSGTAVFLIWHVRPELATKGSAETRSKLAAAIATGEQKDSKDTEGQIAAEKGESPTFQASVGS
jgi:hypothetical protein